MSESKRWTPSMATMAAALKAQGFSDAAIAGLLRQEASE